MMRTLQHMELNVFADGFNCYFSVNCQQLLYFALRSTDACVSTAVT